MLVLVLIAAAAPWFNIPRDQADSAGMLAHLHGFFVGRDLLYDDEYFALGMSPLFAFVTDEGVVSNHWPAGATWLQAPGYLAGLAAGSVLADAKVAPQNPLGVVPLLAVRTWALLLLAWFGYEVGRWVTSRVGARAGVLTAAAFIVATPLLYYAAESPLRPHLYGACVVLILTRIWSTPGYGTPRARAVLLGALAGLATVIRPQLAPLVVLAIHDSWGITDRRARVMAIVAALAAFAVWPLLHFRMQVWMYGPSLVDYAGPVTHHLWHFLWSPYHGALVWCPALVIGLLAVALAVARRERGAWLIAVLLISQIWLDSGMRNITPGAVLGTRTWAGGVAFGPRKLVDVLPLLIPSVIALIEWARAHSKQTVLLLMVVAAAVPTLLLHVSAFADPQSTGTVHDWTSLAATMRAGLDPTAALAAARARSLPLAVPVMIVLAMTPVAVLVLWARRTFARVGANRAVVGGTIAVLALGVIAHAWLASLEVRSEARMAEDPERMVRAQQRMLPRHITTVSRIEQAMELMRRRLGASAAPPLAHDR